MWWSRRNVSQGLGEQHQVRRTHAVNAASARGSNQAAQLGAKGAGCRAQVVQQLGQDVRPRLLRALQGAHRCSEIGCVHNKTGAIGQPRNPTQATCNAFAPYMTTASGLLPAPSMHPP